MAMLSRSMPSLLRLRDGSYLLCNIKDIEMKEGKRNPWSRGTGEGQPSIGKIARRFFLLFYKRIKPIW
jgi:hypothetical protein